MLESNNKMRVDVNKSQLKKKQAVNVKSEVNKNLGVSSSGGYFYV